MAGLPHRNYFVRNKRPRAALLRMEPCIRQGSRLERGVAERKI